MKQLSSLLKISVSVFISFFSLTASGGDPYRPSAGAGEAGMGYVCIMKNGFWSSFHNQASLAFNNSSSFGFNYENRFSIKELGTRSVGMTIPAGKASLGAVYTHFGYTDFKREMTGLACGMKLSDKISAGVQIDYFSERTSREYINNQSITCETGLLITPSENIGIGIHLFNPVPNSIRKTYLPTTLRIGAETYLSKVLFAGVETEMSSGSKLIFRTGFEYEAAKKLWLRGGFSTNNNSFSFGSGYLAKIAQIDFGFTTHEKLGVTSSVSIVFEIH
ncbi:MAG: hypothetical protein NT144_05340 [Bacteroidia bacterium]|nr:hypothetical protein [Bacteroidia bacterium]